MKQVCKQVREKMWRCLLAFISGISLLFSSMAAADCVKPVYLGENLWKLVARVGSCFEDSFEQINSAIDTITCSNPACEVTITQDDIPYVITQPGIYCLAESVTNTGVNDFLITVSASNVILDLTQHVMDGGNQNGYQQGAQDGIRVWPGVQNVTIRNGTLAGFAQYGINASAGLQPNIQTPINCLTLENIKVLDIIAYLPGQSNIDFYADAIGSTLDSLSAVSGFDPVLECCLGNEFTRIKTPAGIFVDCANKVIINGCSVLNAQGDGVYLRYVQEGLLQNCQSDSNGGNGFVFDNCDVTCVQSCGAEQNGLNGFYEVACNGDNSYKDSNAKQNGVHGFRVIGSGKTIERCAANQNTLSGFYVVTAENSTVDGSLDITFGGDGKVTTNPTPDGEGFGVALQKDGKIVAAGAIGVDFGVLRYNTDGSLDDTFDGDGIVVTNFGGNDFGNAITIQEDGKIVVVGRSNAAFALARYNPDGMLDSSFDGDGKVTSPAVGTNALAVALQEDGNIVVAGQNGFAGALARYDTNGSLDGTFAGGSVTPPIAARGVAIQEDGKIVVAGEYDNGNDLDFGLARYNTDGTLDMGFGSSGVATADFGGNDDVPFNLAIQKDGKIIVVGRADSIFGLARFNSDGSLDSSFGVNGLVATSFPSMGIQTARDIAIQKDGRIVVVGDNDNTFVLARYYTNGDLDSSFGMGGQVTTTFVGSELARGVVLQADGKIVAVGGITEGGGGVILARYNIFKRPCVIQDCIALENGQDGFNIVDAAQATLLRNVASNNGCNGFIAPAPFASTLDVLAKNIADNNQCANFSNIDSVLLDAAVLPWANVAGN